MSDEKQTKACPYCAEEILVDAIVCKHCGKALVASEKTKKKKRGGCLKTVGYLILALIVLAVAATLLSQGDKPGASVSTSTGNVAQAPESQESTSVAKPTVTPAPIAPPYEEICAPMVGMTEAQWKQHTANLTNSIATDWTGWVEDVNVKAFGGFELLVDMNAPDALMSVQDVTFDIADDIALRFSKDQPVTFTGAISSISNIIGSCQVRLEGVLVSPDTIQSLQPEFESPITGDSLDIVEFGVTRNAIVDMTEAQFKLVADQLKGKSISNWSGWVENVNVKTFGGNEVWIDMDSPDTLMSVQDVTFDVPDDLALSLSKDAPIVFSGEIESVTNILGSLQIQLKNGTVTP